MTITLSPTGSPGRLPAGQRAARHEQVLDAALAELIERGHDNVTTAGIAARAKASKQTLYAWFGSLNGIYEALIQRSADQSVSGTMALLDAGAAPVEVLNRYAVALLSLITSPGSIALNRAAMSSPDLSSRLLTSGRHRIGPLVEAYFADLDAVGHLSAADPAASFCRFYGVVVQDTQIRTLLGEDPPGAREIERRAHEGVQAFMRLSEPIGGSPAPGVAADRSGRSARNGS